MGVIPTRQPPFGPVAPGTVEEATHMHAARRGRSSCEPERGVVERNEIDLASMRRRNDVRGHGDAVVAHGFIAEKMACPARSQWTSIPIIPASAIHSIWSNSVEGVSAGSASGSE